MNPRLATSRQPIRPNIQPFRYFDSRGPQPRWRPAFTQTDVQATQQPPVIDTDKLHLISWNIDFSTPAPTERMTEALKYLNKLQNEHDDRNGPPTVIFLQEMVHSDLQLLQEASWVQERFHLTDTSDQHWRGTYGTTTLVDRRLQLERVFRVPYPLSFMQRDALFVDIKLQSSIIRLCNTHLESLASGTPKRSVQLKLASELMHGTAGCSFPDDSGDANATDGLLQIPNAAILAGDLNAFAPEDVNLPSKCDLKDAYLALGGTEGSEEGFTWGYQCPDWMDGQFPCGRLDKVLFCGNIGTLSLAKIGQGLKARIDVRIPEECSGPPTDDDFEDIWVTDHFGLVSDFKIVQSGSA